MNVPKIRVSERASFKRCQARWWWDYREGLVRKDQSMGPLWFGTGVHLALALWYSGPGQKRGPEPAETWEEYSRGALSFVKTRDADEEHVAKYEDARSLGVAMLEGYRELWGRDDRWDVIAPERTFHLDIPWPSQAIWEAPADEFLATLVGTFDLVYRDTESGRIWLGEHKTAKAVMTQHLTLDNQAGTYWAVATTELQREGLLGPKEFPAGIMYNFLKKSLPDERPRDDEGYFTNKPVKADYVAALEAAEYLPVGVTGISGKESLTVLEGHADALGLRVLGPRSKVQPGPLFERHPVFRTKAERRTQLLRVQTDALQMEVFRDGVLPLSKTPTRDCRWDCSFFDMCELQERGGDWESQRDLLYVAEDPYAAHRGKSTDE